MSATYSTVECTEYLCLSSTFSICCINHLFFLFLPRVDLCRDSQFHGEMKTEYKHLCIIWKFFRVNCDSL